MKRGTAVGLGILVLGVILLVIGLFQVLSFGDTLAQGGVEQASTGFAGSLLGMVLLFLGGIMILIGGVFLFVSNLKATSSYVADQSAPAYKTIARAVSSGVKEGLQGKKATK